MEIRPSAHKAEPYLSTGCPLSGTTCGDGLWERGLLGRPQILLAWHQKPSLVPCARAGSTGSAHPCGHAETQMERSTHGSPTGRCHLSLLPPRGPSRHWSCGCALHCQRPGSGDVCGFWGEERMFLHPEWRSLVKISGRSVCDEASTTFFRFKRTKWICQSPCQAAYFLSPENDGVWFIFPLYQLIDIQWMELPVAGILA